jgi:DNA-binding NarL/FixJ family response regulator
VAEGRDGVWNEVLVRSGRPGVTVLSGPLGIGRSTLLRRLSHETGARYVAGLALVSDLRLLTCSRIVGADLSTEATELVVEQLRTTSSGPLVVDDAQDVDAESLSCLIVVGRERPVVLGWRLDGVPPPLDDGVDELRLPPLDPAAAAALARSTGAGDDLVGSSGGNPGLLLALAGLGDRLRYEASGRRTVERLSAPARRSLAALAGAGEPVPPSILEQGEELVEAGLAEIVEGRARSTHGPAAAHVWDALTEDERRAMRRRLADELEDPVAVTAQLVALGDAPAAVALARRAAPDATPAARARLTALVAEHTGDPTDHAVAAEAAVRFTDASAAARHAVAAVGEPTACLRTGQAQRLAGDLASARDTLTGCADGRGETGAEIAGVEARLIGAPVPLATEPRQAAERAEAAGDLDAAVTARVIALAHDLAMSADPEPERSTSELLELGRRTGAPIIRDHDELLAVAEFHAGTVGTELADALGDATGPLLRLHRALALAQAGRTGDASTVLDDGSWPDTPAWRSARWWARAETAVLAGRLVTCAAAASEARADVAPTFPIVDLATLVACRAAVESGERPRPAPSRSPLAGVVDAEIAALEGLAAGAPDAADRFDAAAVAWAGRHHPAALRCRLAAAELRLPDPVAVTALERLVDEADRLGLRVLVARARRQLHRAGVRRKGSSGAAGVGALSPREQEVLVLVGAGASSREIANQLGVAPSTVDTQVKSAMQKLGARTRLQAAAKLGATS